jgi:hypothetical protein
MLESLSLGQQLVVTLVTGFIPAIITSTGAFVLSQRNYRQELGKLEKNFQLQEEGQVHMLRQKYISPLSYWAVKLNGRMSELKYKMEHREYDEAKGWFKIVKDHAAGDYRRADFAAWMRYEGIFATTTLYYVCSYFQSVWAVQARSPLTEIDPVYAGQLNGLLLQVSEAFGGEFGLWDSSQVILGELFTDGDSKMQYAKLCEILESSRSFETAPFLRPLDFFLDLNLERVNRVKAALDELSAFLSRNLKQASAAKTGQREMAPEA